MHTFFVPYCITLLYIFFILCNYILVSIAFCPLGFCNIVTERCVPFLARQIAALGVDTSG